MDWLTKIEKRRYAEMYDELDEIKQCWDDIVKLIAAVRLAEKAIAEAENLCRQDLTLDAADLLEQAGYQLQSGEFGEGG